MRANIFYTKYCLVVFYTSYCSNTIETESVKSKAESGSDTHGSSKSCNTNSNKCTHVPSISFRVYLSSTDGDFSSFPSFLFFDESFFPPNKGIFIFGSNTHPLKYNLTLALFPLESIFQTLLSVCRTIIKYVVKRRVRYAVKTESRVERKRGAKSSFQRLSCTSERRPRPTGECCVRPLSGRNRNALYGCAAWRRLLPRIVTSIQRACLLLLVSAIAIAMRLLDARPNARLS